MDETVFEMDWKQEASDYLTSKAWCFQLWSQVKVVMRVLSHAREVERHLAACQIQCSMQAKTKSG